MGVKMKGLFALGYLAFWLFMACMWCYGIYLAFCASLIIGFLALILEPSPVIFGLVMFFFEKDLAQIIYNWLAS
jgi:hypothetical protein